MKAFHLTLSASTVEEAAQVVAVHQKTKIDLELLWYL